MTRINVQPIRGFRDLYPEDKITQNYIFEKIKQVAYRYGFEPYDGPVLENIEIYLDKTSKNLIERQTFQFRDKKDKVLILRPEMTPSLARMVAKRSKQLIFPLRFFNLGLRFRYEAPQKGREREFYQADFDILGSRDIISDAEILSVAVQIFLSFGAKKEDFILFLNSRTFMEKKLADFGIDRTKIKAFLNIIDRKDKTTENAFVKSLEDEGLDREQIAKLKNFLEIEIKPSSDPYFDKLFKILKDLRIDQYCRINPSIVRGLDYYTGLVFEVKEVSGIRRSLLGGGRYDNLISSYVSGLDIPGVGFAISDVVLIEFLKDKNLLPLLDAKPTQVLVTIFNEELLPQSAKTVQTLRSQGISAELYPSLKKIDKQLKYADKAGIPYVIIIGPEEVKKNLVKLKNMKTGEQIEVSENNLAENLKTQIC